MLLSLLMMFSTEPKIICGKVIDISDNQPVYSAMIYTKKDTIWTNLDGSFQIPVDEDGYFVQGLGFQSLIISNPKNGETVGLKPLTPYNVRIRKK